jgi:hypothetical protein
MRSTRLRQSLVVSATFGLALLVVVLIGFGVAIRLGTVIPPELDLRFYQIHILAYRTDYPQCPPTTLCPSDSILTPPAFYVLWRIHNVATTNHPAGQAAKRLLVVPLQRRYGSPYLGTKRSLFYQSRISVDRKG